MRTIVISSARTSRPAKPAGWHTLDPSVRPGARTLRRTARRSSSIPVVLKIGFWALSFTFVAGPAIATVGAGIGAAPVSIARPLNPGATIDAPSVLIANTGTEAGVFRVRVRARPGSPGREIPAGWVTFQRNDVPLDASDRALVPMRVSVPRSAPHGNYRSQLVVNTVASGSESVAFSAEATTDFVLRVGASSHRHVPLPRPWQLLALGGLAALFALWRSGLRVRISRR